MEIEKNMATKKITRHSIAKEFGINSKIDIANQIATLTIEQLYDTKPLAELSDDYIRSKITPKRIADLSDSLIFDVSRGSQEKFNVQILESLIIWESDEGEKYIISGNTRRAALIHLHKKYGDDQRYKFLPIPFKKLRSNTPPNQYQLLMVQINTNDTGVSHTPLELGKKVKKVADQLEKKYGEVVLEDGKKFKVNKFLSELFGFVPSKVTQYKNIGSLDQRIITKINKDEISTFTAELLFVKCRNKEKDIMEVYNDIQMITIGKITKKTVLDYFDNNIEKVEDKAILEDAKDYKQEIKDALKTTQITPDLEGVEIREEQIAKAVFDENSIKIDDKPFENDDSEIFSNPTQELEFTLPDKEEFGKSSDDDLPESNDEDDYKDFQLLLKNIDNVNKTVTDTSNIDNFNAMAEMTKDLIAFMYETNEVFTNKENVDIFDLVAELFAYRFASITDEKMVRKLSTKIGKKEFVKMIEKFNKKSAQILDNFNSPNTNSIKTTGVLEIKGTKVS